MKTNKRDISIDILRGIAIVMVVIGHSGFKYTKYIYMFHVPLFFLISGFLRSRDCQHFTDLKNFVINKLKRLYIPYIQYNCIFLLFSNLFLILNVYHTRDSLSTYPELLGSPVEYNSIISTINSLLSTLLFCGGSQLGGALWFLRTMFITSIIFEIENLVLLKSNWKIYFLFIFNLILFSVGYYFSSHNLHTFLNAESFLTIMVFYSLGSLLKFYQNKKPKGLLQQGLLLLFCVTVFFIASIGLNVNIGKNEFSSAIGVLSTSITAFIILYYLAKLISVTFLSSIFQYLGKHTIEILALHFLAFKLVSWLLVIKFDEPYIFISSYPYYLANYWWLYTIVGVSIPLIFAFIKDNIQKKYEKKQCG